MKTIQRQNVHNRATGLCTRCHRTGAVEVVGLVCDRFGASAQPTELKTIADNNRPSNNLRTSATIPLGAFTQDYEFIVDYGDLDQCNGQIGRAHV